MEKETHERLVRVIKNFSSLQSEKCCSVPVMISDCKWRLTAYPKGTNNSHYLSVFLEVVDFESLPCGWGRYVTFRITLVNQFSKDLTIVEEAEHCFDGKSTTLGFPEMLPLTEFHQKDGGYMVNGEIVIYAELDVIKVVSLLDDSEIPEEASKLVCEIKNFSFSPSEKCYSEPFVIGGFKWHLLVECDLVFLYVYLCVADCQPLPSEAVKVRLTIVNQLSAKQSILKDSEHCFDKKSPTWGYTIPLALLAEDGGFLVNGDLIIVAEVVGATSVFEDSLSMIKQEVNGFHVLHSQVQSVRRIFERHPDIALEIRAKNQHLRTTYMNFLLSLIETLYQPLQELSNEDLVEADYALTYLKDVGFKVDWLEKKLDQIKEKKERELSCEARVQVMEAQLHDLKHKLETEKANLSATRALLSFDDVV